MTIAEWGSIGEVVGSAGVLVTLIFLVAQMRQNTLAIKSTSLEGVLSGYATFNREWFGTSPNSAENRSVWTRGHERFDSLSDSVAVPAHPGIFAAGSYYADALDNHPHSTTLFVFLNNRTVRPLTAYLGFESERSATLFLDGELVAYSALPSWP